MRALVKDHGHELLFALAPVVEPRSAVFERGFLAACQTRFRTPAQRALATHPAWSTVTTLTTDDAQVVHAAKALRVLHLRPRLLEALAKGPPLPVEALRVRVDSWPLAASLRAALRDTRAFPRLDDLQVGAEPSGEPIRAEAFAWLFECPFGPALRRFAVAKDPAEGAGVALAGWLSALPATLERASFRAYGFEVVLTREADGRWGVEVVPRGPHRDVRAWAAAVVGVDAARVARVVVRGAVTGEERGGLDPVSQTPGERWIRWRAWHPRGSRSRSGVASRTSSRPAPWRSCWT
ncbi:MAG: hypothetical protein JNL79_36250, partial [Myxococcales bacterium]|nr:hypothetical protein [Myxococcales bacterium]